MDELEPVVVRHGDGEAPPGNQTTGMRRLTLLDRGEVWAGWVATDPGVAGGWHHHGDRETYFYVIRGSIRVEFAGGERDSIVVNAGGFAYVPPRIVHREISGKEPPEAFLMRLGPGPVSSTSTRPSPAGSLGSPSRADASRHQPWRS